MKSKITDERIIQLKHKIQSDAFTILLIVLLASVVVQQYILQAPAAQYLVELAAAIGIAIYVTLRSIFAANESMTEVRGGAGIVITNALIVGASITALNGVLNYLQYGDRYTSVWLFIATLAVTFVFATIGAVVLFGLLSALSSYSDRRMQRRLDELE